MTFGSTVVEFNDTASDGVADPHGKGSFWSRAKRANASNLRKKMIYDSPGVSIDLRYHFLPNYFGACIYEPPCTYSNQAILYKCDCQRRRVLKK